MLTMPASRPMPTTGKKCHELRILDETATWRIVYRLEPDAVVILDIFSKKTTKTPRAVIDLCKERLGRYLKAAKED